MNITKAAAIHPTSKLIMPLLEITIESINMNKNDRQTETSPNATSDEDIHHNNDRNQRFGVEDHKQIIKPFGDIIKSKSKILTSVIKANAGVFQRVNEESMKETESSILQDVIAIERSALFSAMATSAVSFLGIHYLPQKFIQRYASPVQKDKLAQSYITRRSTLRGRVGIGLGYVLEVGFALYAGTLAYEAYHSSEKDGSGHEGSVYARLARIPLVDGPSVIADELCSVGLRSECLLFWMISFLK